MQDATQGKGQTELFQNKVLLPHYAQQKEEIKNKHMTNIFKRARGYQLQLISMNILHHPSGLPRTNTN